MTKDTPLIIFLACIAILIYLYLTDDGSMEERPLNLPKKMGEVPTWANLESEHYE